MSNEMGAKLRKLRLEKGLTQKEVGLSVGISDKVVSAWECGYRDIRQVRDVKNLCELFEIEYGDLLGKLKWKEKKN